VSISALEKLSERRGAAVLLEVLSSERVRCVFGNPGPTELPLIDAPIDPPDNSRIYNERFEGFIVRRFDGSKVRITGGELQPV
jgi:hypothetical protein